MSTTVFFWESASHGILHAHKVIQDGLNPKRRKNYSKV